VRFLDILGRDPAVLARPGRMSAPAHANGDATSTARAKAKAATKA